MTECKLTYFNVECEHPEALAFVENAQELLQFYIDVFKVSRLDDKKMQVLFGSAGFRTAPYPHTDYFAQWWEAQKHD